MRTNWGVLAVAVAAAIANSKYNLCGDFFQHVCVPPLRFMSVAALSAVLGHIFPVWLRFKGGKGVATALGVVADDVVACPWSATAAAARQAWIAQVAPANSAGDRGERLRPRWRCRGAGP